MNKILTNLFIFAAGAAIGSAVTCKVVKTKYEQIAQEEIDSVKEMWARRNRRENDEETSSDEEMCEDEEEDDGFDDRDVDAYSTLTSAYSQSGDIAENVKEGVGDDEVPYINGPYVISPTDFGSGDYEHDLYCLTYYTDGVLSNDWYEELDIEETIGRDSLEHFGDYADDIVHVRNERLNADYEVVRDYRSYSDLIADDPLMQAYAN